MTTSITRPLKDRRPLAEKQEAALLALFRCMTPPAKIHLMRRARAILDEDQRRSINILRR